MAYTNVFDYRQTAKIFDDLRDYSIWGVMKVAQAVTSFSYNTRKFKIWFSMIDIQEWLPRVVFYQSSEVAKPSWLKWLLEAKKEGSSEVTCRWIALQNDRERSREKN